MSENKNQEMIREILRRFGDEADPQGLIDAFSKNVEVVSIGPEGAVPWAGTYRGKQEAVRFVEAYDTIKYEAFEPLEYTAFENTVVVQGRERWTAKATGRTCVNEWAVVFTLKDFKITKMRLYEDTAAVAQAITGQGPDQKATAPARR